MPSARLEEGNAIGSGFRLSSAHITGDRGWRGMMRGRLESVEESDKGNCPYSLFEEIDLGVGTATRWRLRVLAGSIYEQ